MTSKKHLLLISAVGLLAWLPTLNFWFFKAYEATWLTSIAPYNLISLIKGHAFLYFLNQKIFGWNPWGWYLIGIILHILASLLLYKFVFIFTKNRFVALISSLFFIVSTSYNDVLTWGSFNSYYPLLLICFLSSLIFFLLFKEKNRILYLFLSLAFAFLGFYVRETGIVIIPAIFFLDLITSINLKNKKRLFKIVKRQFPFLLIFIAFFVIRTLYGGTPGDSADSNVKLQMRFVSDGLYFEYAKASFLTFGKLIPPQIIPYDLLNFIRELLAQRIFYEHINTYFFPILGWVAFIALGIAFVFIRKSKKFSRPFLFFFAWLGLFSLFVSLALPHTPEVLAREYEYNTMRYRYFAFLGTSVIGAILFVSLLKKKTLFLAVLAVILINLLLVWKIEKEVYANQYKPAKEFNNKFNFLFPSLPTKTVFYLYPHAPSLGDYLLEWFIIRDTRYKNFNNQPFRVESQVIAVLDKLKKEKIELSDVLFLDYNKKSGLVDETEKIKKLILNQKDQEIRIKNQGGNLFESDVFRGPLVEFPQYLDLSFSAQDRDNFSGTTPDSQRFRALVNYSLQRQEYLRNSKITTEYTMSQREGEPFFHVLPKNLTDGNTGVRSSWIADSFKPWIQVDLGEEKEISAVSWGSLETSTRAPATYKILVSKDGRSWETGIDVKNSIQHQKLDVFEKPLIGRFIRMEIRTTSGGDFVLVDEFDVITSSASEVLNYYKDRDTLFHDLDNIFKFAQTSADIYYAKERGFLGRGKLSWETNKTTAVQNNQITRFSYDTSSYNHNLLVELPESEIYSGTGDFLEKYFTKVLIEFGEAPFDISVNSVKLVPRIKL